MLENEIIKLRALELSDIDLLYKWENNTELWKVSNTIAPFSKYILKKYIENSHLDIYQTKELKLMIDVKISENKYKTVGILDVFDFDPFNKRAEVGILIHKQERDKKYATESLKILIDYAFNYLKIHQLYCNISKNNKASIRLFENCEFKITGEKKDWKITKNDFEDIYFLQLINK